jgi:hypothetical protein
MIDELKTDKSNNNFVIDFFELAFLTEACLPSSPIARHCFFMNTIDRYYFQMTWGQRKHFFEWITPKLDMKHEESKMFHARYNPENQYLVITSCEGKEENVEAFLFEEKYMITSTQRINEDYIFFIEKLVI